MRNVIAIAIAAVGWEEAYTSWWTDR